MKTPGMRLIHCKCAIPCETCHCLDIEAIMKLLKQTEAANAVQLTVQHRGSGTTFSAEHQNSARVTTLTNRLESSLDYAAIV